MTSTKTIYDLLREHPFFSELSDEQVEFVSSCGQNRHFRPGEYLAKEGEAADHFFLVRSGSITVQIQHPAKGPVIIGTLGEGDIGGFSWIFPPYRMHFDLKAIAHTSVIDMDGKCLREKCMENHHLGFILMQESAKVMDKRLKNTRIQLLDVYN
jgi:CRP-like cAMP-binding protein